jgi:hypothetical protein
VALFIGLGHSFSRHADGALIGCYDWSSTPLRKHVELRTHRDGDGFVPKARGTRREEIVNELSGMFRTRSSDQRGRAPGGGVPTVDVVAELDRLRAVGLTLDAACSSLAETLHWSPATLYSNYYRSRRPKPQLE